MRYCKQFAIGKLPIIVFSFFMFSDVNAHFKNFNFKHPLADTTKKDSAKYEEYKSLPLKPARKINFTTNEGSWMSVDVSPDGQTIAFDLMGDLYTVPVSGGNATRLTKGLAYDVHPRYSPDGKKILFFLTAAALIMFGASTWRKKIRFNLRMITTNIFLMHAGHRMVNMLCTQKDAAI